MQSVFLDNAATTPMDPEVFEAMKPFFTDHFGNPSSIHSFGRKTKDAIETARRTIAEILNCKPAEVCFTSGGTEADNMAINDAIKKRGVKTVITSPIEHHAVLHSCDYVASKGFKVCYVNCNGKGDVDLDHLTQLLKENENCLVSLMHANNEIGNLLDLKKVSAICREHGALLHSDTVQTMGHYDFDLEDLDIDYITGSAHKFHGPKGIGFLYHKGGSGITPLIYGGSQERNKRAGTENLYGIVGLAKALEIANRDLKEHQEYIRGIKEYAIAELKNAIPNVEFNGRCTEDSLYTVLSVKLPETPMASMMLFNMDLEGIAVSGGSACTSGASKGSHVMAALDHCHGGPNVRMSFSKMNTKADIDKCVAAMAKHSMVAV